MKDTSQYFIIACLIVAILTGCGAQPQAIQEAVALSPATQTSQPTPLPPTESEPPTEVVLATPSPLPPTATSVPASPTPAPEVAVNQLADLLGTWQFLFEGENYLIQFQNNGFWNLGWEGNLTAVDRGKYTLEGNILHFLTSPRGCPDAGEATYEAYVILVDGKPTKLHLLLVGEDNCANRKQSLADKTLPLFKR